jgi:hypothetical protein
MWTYFFTLFWLLMVVDWKYLVCERPWQLSVVGSAGFFAVLWLLPVRSNERVVWILCFALESDLKSRHLSPHH